jgi:hypothetical protein
MLRSIPFSLGPLLVFAAWLTFEPGSAAAATKQKVRRSGSDQRASSPVIRHGVTAKNKPIIKSTVPEPAREKEAAAQGSAAPPAPTASAVRGPNRIDFNERLIQGQTNKSGAVYLYDRKELKTPSMIKKRESFREETLATIYGN